LQGTITVAVCNSLVFSVEISSALVIMFIYCSFKGKASFLVTYSTMVLL
jgi:hypothetical protein